MSTHRLSTTFAGGGLVVAMAFGAAVTAPPAMASTHRADSSGQDATAIDDDSVADVIEKAELAAVGAPTPAEAPSPVVQDGATVDVNGSDLSVTMGASKNAVASDSGQYATVQDDSVTYAASHPGEGTTRFAAVLADATDARPQWTFAVGAQLLPLDDGTVSISDGEKFLGGIDAPWAIDAEGRSLPTHYEITGSTLTQIVDTTGASFPVVADPTVNFYGPYIQVRLNKAESYAAIGGYAACAGVLSKSPVPFAKALQIACTTVAAIGTTQLAGGNCISIHYVVGLGGPAGVWWPWIRKC